MLIFPPRPISVGGNNHVTCLQQCIVDDGKRPISMRLAQIFAGGKVSVNDGEQFGNGVVPRLNALNLPLLLKTDEGFAHLPPRRSSPIA